MKEKKPINVEIGQNVKQIRESAGLTQESFAELIGLGEKHVSVIERGAAGLSLPTLRRICTLLSVSADTVLFGPEDGGSRNGRDAEVRALAERLERLPDKQFKAAKDILDKLMEALAAN